MLRIIREVEPPLPSSRLSASGPALEAISQQRKMEPTKLTKLMRGELDWIVMKSLEKDRNRRYETANGLAQDIERFLNDEPIIARRPTLWNRARKWSRRHKAAARAITAVSSLIVLTAAVL